MEPLTIILTGVKAWAPTVVSVLLIPIILWIISQVEKNERESFSRDATQKKDFSEALAAALKAMTDQFDKNRQDTYQRIEDQVRRICILEQEAVRKEEFYQATSGWRTEINRLSDQISATMNSTMDKIIALWREKGKNET